MMRLEKGFVMFSVLYSGVVAQEKLIWWNNLASSSLSYSSSGGGGDDTTSTTSSITESLNQTNPEDATTQASNAGKSSLHLQTYQFIINLFTGLWPLHHILRQQVAHS